MPVAMNRNSLDHAIGAAVLTAGFYLISTGPSYAYLDPGTGSMILTAILGLIAATTYTLKGYLARIKMLFRKGKNDSDRHDSGDKG